MAVPEIYRIGSSAGGMRPKALVLHDPRTGALRSGHAVPREGEIACILKFDGVGTGATAERLGEPMPFNRVEAAYARMAREVGITTSDVQILETDDGHAHLLIRRFDVIPAGRLHQHTLGGLLHVDYNTPGASSYEEYLRTIRRLGMADAAVEEGYLRMLFNVVAVNQDDHVKNLSFHMERDGSWRLTPAYDLTFAKGGGWTASHQMRVADRTSGITAADLERVGRDFGIRAPGRIIERVVATVARWREFGAAAEVPAATTDAVERQLAARRAELTNGGE